MSERPTWLVTGAQRLPRCQRGRVPRRQGPRASAPSALPTEPDALFDRYVASDLEDPVDLVRAIEDVRPDVVLHAAAMASHEACEADPQRARLVNAWASEALARGGGRGPGRGSC